MPKAWFLKVGFFKKKHICSQEQVSTAHKDIIGK